jgi:hypothetical protein
MCLTHYSLFKAFKFSFKHFILFNYLNSFKARFGMPTALCRYSCLKTFQIKNKKQKLEARLLR